MSELHVLCRIADVDYVLPAADVMQMESFTGATRVPGARADVAGLMQIRGRVVPVVDMRDGLRAADHPADAGLARDRHEAR